MVSLRQAKHRQQSRRKLSEHEREQMRILYERHGYGYYRLAKMFEVSKALARRICAVCSPATVHKRWAR